MKKDKKAKRQNAAAFLDLVGIRKLATLSPERYAERLDLFHQFLGDCVDSVLNEEHDKIFFFSDCFYVTVFDFDNDESHLVRLADFVMALRHSLLLNGIFFKCAIARIDLDPLNAGMDWPTLAARSTRLRKRRNVVQGFYFGAASAKLYGSQESFKGVGIRLAGSADDFKVLQDQDRLVQSCFIEPRSRAAVPYLDLRMTRDERKTVCFSKIMESVLWAKSQDTGFAQYYLSLIVTWMSSISLKSEDVLADFMDNGKIDAFDPLLESFLDGKLPLYLSELTGYEIVFFTFINTLVRESSDIETNLKNELWSLVSRENRSVKLLKGVPSDVIDDDGRRHFVDRVSRYLRESQGSNTKRRKP